MHHFKIKQVALSQVLGIGKGYVSQMVNDHSPITTKVVNNLIKSFPKLNSNWLLTGYGEMLLHEDIGKTYQIEETRIRTLDDLQEDYKADPLAGLRDIVRRLEELERWRAEVESRGLE